MVRCAGSSSGHNPMSVPASMRGFSVSQESTGDSRRPPTVTSMTKRFVKPAPSSFASAHTWRP